MNQRNAACLLATAIVSVLLLIIACDDDKPTEPTPPAEPADYVFYFNDGANPDQYHRYHCADGRVDTVTIPYWSYDGLAVAADGSRLYLSVDDTTVVVDTDSFHVVEEINLDSRNGASVSQDNQYVAILGDDINILRTSDYSLVFHDTDRVHAGVFSADSKSFYCVGGWSYVYRVDLSDPEFEVRRHLFPRKNLWEMVPSVDENKWFFYVSSPSVEGTFEVYDVGLDSIIHREPISPAAGDIEISPDGKYIFYSTGHCFECPEEPSSFTVFDVEANAVHRVISTEEFAEAVPGYLPIGPLAITPDGRRLVAVQAPTGGAEFVILDVETMEIERHFQLGRQTIIHHVACQKGL